MKATGARSGTGRAPKESAAPNSAAQAGGAPGEVVAAFLSALQQGEEWFSAILRATADWTVAEEVWRGRRYCYLIGGEAFDWLLLAERLLAEAGDLVAEEERVRLLFHSQTPDALDAARLREAIGPLKYKALLNFWYGICVEEAVLQAALEEAAKARQGQPAREADLEEEAFHHLYGAAATTLLGEYRAASGLPHGEESSLEERRAFTYWLFKQRVAKSEPARLASDTRKGLLWLYLQRPPALRWVEEGAGAEG